eukprot:6112744-Prymnesium_polylepis.1
MRNLAKKWVEATDAPPNMFAIYKSLVVPAYLPSVTSFQSAMKKHITAVSRRPPHGRARRPRSPCTHAAPR